MRVCVQYSYLSVYIYIYRERERERKRDICIYRYIHIIYLYIYIYKNIYVCIYIYTYMYVFIYFLVYLLIYASLSLYAPGFLGVMVRSGSSVFSFEGSEFWVLGALAFFLPQHRACMAMPTDGFASKLPN